jgi:hypothetical protein
MTILLVACYTEEEMINLTEHLLKSLFKTKLAQGSITLLLTLTLMASHQILIRKILRNKTKNLFLVRTDQLRDGMDLLI